MTTDSGGGIGPKSLFAASSVQVPVKFGRPCAAVEIARRQQGCARRQIYTSLHRMLLWLLPTYDSPIVMFHRMFQQIRNVLGQQVAAVDELEG